MFTLFYDVKCLKLKILIVLISLCLIQNSAGIHPINVSTSPSEPISRDFCEKSECNTKSVFEKKDFNNASLDSEISEYFVNIDISTQCKDSLTIYFNEVMNLNPWALEMLDASGKIPSSFFSITMIDYGSEDDCIRIKANSNDGKSLFKGKFCMLHLRHPLFQTPHLNQFIGKSYVEAFGAPPDWIKSDIEDYIPLRFGYYGGICMPSTCTDKELHSVISSLAEPLDLGVKLTDCQVEEPLKVSSSIKLVMLFLVFLSLVCVTGTILDLKDLKQEKKFKLQDESLNRQLLKSFSIYTNTKELFTLSTRKSSLSYINGFRAIICVGIMWGHTMCLPTHWKELRFKNFHFIFEFLEIAIENNGPFMVDWFFALTGFLLGYFTWKKLEENNGRFNVFESILQKYWRLTAPQIFTILLLYLMQPIFNLGPIWNSSMQHEHENCYRNGWKNLLFIQNFNSMTEICMAHTWYIANTMQHLIISLPLIIATYRYPKTGITLGLLLYFVPNIYYYFLSLNNQFPYIAFTGLRYTHYADEVSSQMYPYSSYHLPANLIGIFAGWACYKYGTRTLPKMWLTVGWIMCILCFYYVILSIKIPTNDFRIMALYNTTRVSVTALGTCWIFYACGSGQGGIVDKILSAKILVPLCRISYSVFLAHPLYLTFREAITSERYYMDRIMNMSEIVPYVLCSLFGGFLLYILIEEPFNKMYDPLKKRIISLLTLQTSQRKLKITLCTEKKSDEKNLI